MFFYLVLLFTIIPAIELFVLIEVGGIIGAANTILLIITTGVLGASLARAQGFAVLQNIQNSLNEGRMPTDEMVNGVMILVGGLLLLTPGFLTDTFGFMLLIPLTRAIIKKLITAHMNHVIIRHPSAGEEAKPFPPREKFEDAEFRE